MEIDSLVEMLRSHQYGLCRRMTEEALAETGLSAAERAYLYYILSRSLAGVGLNQEALGPGEMAVCFARESDQWDLLGRAICNSGYLYGVNRLYKKAVSRLEEFFPYVSRYEQALSLQGWVYYNLAVFYREWGRLENALTYYEKAYEWHLEKEPNPQKVERYRANLIWQMLRMGRVDDAKPLLTLSEQHVKEFPGESDVWTRLHNNLAYVAYLQGDYPSALHLALAVLQDGQATPGRRAHACLVLHYVTKALTWEKEALSLGIMARLQALLAKRWEIEEEVTRSLLQVQQREGVPSMEELLKSLERLAHVN